MPALPERSRWAGAALTVLLTLATACSAGTDTASTPAPPSPLPAGTPSPSAPSRPSPSPSPSTTADPVPDPDDPRTAATRWLVAYHSASWTDSSPAAWIDRVRPYVTDTLHASNETLRTGGGGSDWADYVSHHCASSVTDTRAVIPPESPGTPTAANVQITGTIHTTCTAGPPASPTEPTSATLVVVKTTTGWRVDRRLF